MDASGEEFEVGAVCLICFVQHLEEGECSPLRVATKCIGAPARGYARRRVFELYRCVEVTISEYFNLSPKETLTVFAGSFECSTKMDLIRAHEEARDVQEDL